MVRRGFRGWEVELFNGDLINEEQVHWNEIPKNQIKRLTLWYDGRSWNIENKERYFQKKRASMSPNFPDSFRIESRSIGYYDAGNKVLCTVDEHTGRMKWEVK